MILLPATAAAITAAATPINVVNVPKINFKNSELDVDAPASDAAHAAPEPDDAETNAGDAAPRATVDEGIDEGVDDEAGAL